MVINWARTLDISDSFSKASVSELPIRQLSKNVANELIKLPPYKNTTVEYEKTNLIELFNELAGSEDSEEYDEDMLKEEFDILLEQLYNWGDGWLDIRSKVCWIKTFKGC